MINLNDIRIGKTYYKVYIYDKGAFEIQEITPTEVFIDEKYRGKNTICAKYKEDPTKITWISRHWVMNEYEPDFLKPVVYIFDDFDKVIKCTELCMDAKVKQIQSEIREKENQIVDIYREHIKILTKYIDKKW